MFSVYCMFNREGRQLGRGCIAELPGQIRDGGLLITIERSDQVWLQMWVMNSIRATAALVTYTGVPLGHD